MEGDEEGSLSAKNESRTGAHQAILEPLKSNPELSKGKLNLSVSPSRSRQRPGRIAVEMKRSAEVLIQSAEVLIRKKDLFHLVVALDKYGWGFTIQTECFSQMNPLIRKLQALVSDFNDAKHVDELGGLMNEFKPTNFDDDFGELGELMNEFKPTNFLTAGWTGVQYDAKHEDELGGLMNVIKPNLRTAKRTLARYDFDLLAYIPRAYFVSSHNRQEGEFGLTHQTSAPDEMLTLAINSAIRQVSAYLQARTFKKIGISGSGVEEVARAVVDIEKKRQHWSVVLCISVCGHDREKEIRQKILEQMFVGRKSVHSPRLRLDLLLPYNFFLLVNCVDEQMDLHDLRLPGHGFVVLTTRSQEVYKIMDVDLEIRTEDHLLPWDLFFENVGRSLVDSSSALQQMAIQLVKECHCHLLAIILLARALKDVTDISVWELALQKLSSHSSAMEEGSSQVMKHVLELVWDQKDVTTIDCIHYCTSRWYCSYSPVSEWISSNLFETEAEGEGIYSPVSEWISSNLVETEAEGEGIYSPVSEWISSNLVETEAEGEGILKDLIGSFLLEKAYNKFFMRTETKVVLNKYFTSYLPSPFVRQGGLGLIKTPTVGRYSQEIELNDNKLSELPENPKWPALRKLQLQNNCDLMEIPELFFKVMPLLVYLDISHTSIKSLPPSISRLVSLKTFYLRGCKLLKKLPPHVGALQKLEDFDFEGTEVLYLPKEICKLTSLRHFKVSLCGHANYYGETKQTGSAIPTEVLSIICRLEELSIDVSPDGEWWDDVNPATDRWDADVKAILNALSSSNKLRILELYLPSVELLQQVNFQNISKFSFIVGRHLQRIIYRLPNGVEERFNRWEKKFKKCLKYINGEGMPSGIIEALKHASVLFLDRHWTVKVLSEFGHENLANLEFCLLVECNELQTILDGDYGCPSGGDKEPILQWLHHLSIHYMKNLESIWQGSIPNYSLHRLRSLTLHTCPNLTTIFPPDMFGNLFWLEELIVEDCPKIGRIVTQEDANVQSGCFLQRLRKIALLDLPQLVTISGPLCLGKKVDSLFIYNCPMLESLYTTERSPEYCKIVGEKEWWDSLRWHDSEWRRMTQPAFEELRTDEDFMDQLAKDVYADRL